MRYKVVPAGQEGKEVERKPCQVQIKELELLDVELPRSKYGFCAPRAPISEPWLQILVKSCR